MAEVLLLGGKFGGIGATAAVLVSTVGILVTNSVVLVATSGLVLVAEAGPFGVHSCCFGGHLCPFGDHIRLWCLNRCLTHKCHHTVEILRLPFRTFKGLRVASTVSAGPKGCRMPMIMCGYFLPCWHVFCCCYDGNVVGGQLQGAHPLKRGVLHEDNRQTKQT